MKNGLISDQQFGFLPGRSTLTQLLSVIDEWARAIDRGEHVAAVFLDFYKAFDRVWHDGLLHKLGKCGLHPSALAWLQNYLSDRSLSVRVCNATSNPITITAGVPQGSHLGPILFVVFINDLPSSVSSRTRLYADDALEYEIGAPPSTISLQRSIDHTTQWAACWHGKFSSCKTELLLVGRQTSADDQVTISIYSSVITECSSHKHLGVTISYNLNWSAHVTQLIKKASRRCGLLRCMSHHLPQLSQVYFISTMFARSLNMPVHCGMEPFRQSWHFHLKSCKLVLPERSCGHRGEHQSNNFWKLLTGPSFAGDVPLQALVFSNSLSMHQTLYHHSLSTVSPFFLPAPPATNANHSR